jgi:hypothetical protein
LGVAANTREPKEKDMSLTIPTIPPVVMRAFTAGLGNYIDPSRPLWSLLQKKFVGLQWWSLNRAAVSQIAGPADTLADFVIPTGWRFLAADGDLYAGCHVGSIKPTSPPILTGVSVDVQILTFAEQLEVLKTLPVIGTGRFELRVIRITWLHFEAFWLTPCDGNGNSAEGPPTNGGQQPPTAPGGFVVPFIGFVEGSPNYLERMKAYPVGDFVERVRCLLRAIVEKESARKDRARKTEAEIREKVSDCLETLAKAARAASAEVPAKPALVRAGKPPAARSRAARKKA